MSNAIGTSYPCPDPEQGNSSKQLPSGAPAVAAQRHDRVPDSAGEAHCSPRPVTRGESRATVLSEGNPYVIEPKGKSVGGGYTTAFEDRTNALQVRTRRQGSVRVNLSVPREVDDVLSGLSEKSGASKASLVMYALQSYLPELRRRLAEHDEIQAYIRRKQISQAKGNAPEGSYEHNLPRSERRRLERERRKAGRGGDSE